MKLKTLPMCAGLSGGRAIELAALEGNIHAFDCIPVMSQLADCNFSFAGIKAWALRTIEKDEEKFGMSHFYYDMNICNWQINSESQMCVAAIKG